MSGKNSGRLIELFKPHQATACGASSLAGSSLLVSSMVTARDSVPGGDCSTNSAMFV